MYRLIYDDSFNRFCNHFTGYRGGLDPFRFQGSDEPFCFLDCNRPRKPKPYRLVIENKGTQKHYFTAEGFFRAIATSKLQSNTDGEVKAPYFSAIEVYPGRTLDLYFIPVTKGSYHLICTIEGHADRGMNGEILIE